MSKKPFFARFLEQVPADEPVASDAEVESIRTDLVGGAGPPRPAKPKPIKNPPVVWTYKYPSDGDEPTSPTYDK